MAEYEAVAVFATNLRKLLLTPPVRDKTILGIDPGFRNGCKFALISATGLLFVINQLVGCLFVLELNKWDVFFAKNWQLL
jgi:transcriptional accessory protein Tex/SPT6